MSKRGDYKMLTAYHGTKLEFAISIIKQGFDMSHLPNWTGDLGCGIYGFLDVQNAGMEHAQYAAKMYAKGKYGCKIKVGVVEFTAEIKMSEICNLNDHNQQSAFRMSRQNFGKIIHQKFGSVNSPAAKRNNEDGILIEALIKKRKWPNWKAIVRDTYTPLNGEASISNFPNTREICIRDLHTITKCRCLAS